MNEDELRALIRRAVDTHLGTARSAEAPEHEPARRRAEVSISFGQYQLERSPGETTCLIEPAVRCNHCGFCKCHGH